MSATSSSTAPPQSSSRWLSFLRPKHKMSGPILDHHLLDESASRPVLSSDSSKMTRIINNNPPSDDSVVVVNIEEDSNNNRNAIDNNNDTSSTQMLHVPNKNTMEESIRLLDTKPSLPVNNNNSECNTSGGGNNNSKDSMRSYPNKRSSRGGNTGNVKIPSKAVVFDKQNQRNTMKAFCNSLIASLNMNELAGFCCYAIAVVATACFEILLWVTFFQFVIRPADTSDAIQGGVVWGVAAASLVAFRSYLVSQMPRDLSRVMFHAEYFTWTSLVMVIGANTAFYIHTPQPTPLTDLGFYLIPEQGLKSPWRSLSDTMTMSLPLVCGIQSVFMSRRNRCEIFISFFRLMTVCYGLRMFTIAVTSLPGPAPHCRGDGDDSNEYSPPLNWIDIVTRIGPMHGKFNTCGDLIFSGHMAYTQTTLLLYLRQLDLRFPVHSKKRWAVGMTYLATVAALCIAGRKHYTVDILLGIIISTMVFFHFEHGWVPHAWSQRVPPKVVLEPSSSAEQQLRSLQSLLQGDEEVFFSKKCCNSAMNEFGSDNSSDSSRESSPLDSGCSRCQRHQMANFDNNSAIIDIDNNNVDNNAWSRQPSAYGFEPEAEFVC